MLKRSHKPDLNRELGLLLAAFLGAAALIGGAIAFVFDHVYWYRRTGVK